MSSNTARTSLVAALLVVLGLFGFRYNRSIVAERHQMQGQIAAQKAEISKVQDQVEKKQAWGDRIFAFEMERLKRLRADVDTAQRALESTSSQQAGNVPVQTGKDQTSNAAAEAKQPNPNESPQTEQDLRQKFVDIRVAEANVLQDYDLQVAQSETNYLQEDAKLANQSEEAENNVFRLAEEVSAMAGYVDLQSLRRLENLRTSLVAEQARQSSIRRQREDLQNQLKQAKIQARATREAKLRPLQIEETELQNQIALAQASGQQKSRDQQPQGNARAGAAAGTAAISADQQLARELEYKKRLLADEDRALQSLFANPR